MFFSLDQISHLLLQYKYFILFPIAVIEGPIVTVIAGFLSSLGHMDFLTAYAVIIFGDIAGDIIHYVIGYWGGESFIKKWGKYFGVSPERVLHLEKHFDNHGVKTLFIGKLAHGIGGIFLFAAGMARMSFLKFTATNLLAILIKSLALLIVGFYFGQALTRINSFLEFFGALSISLGISALFICFHYYRKKVSDQPYE